MATLEELERERDRLRNVDDARQEQRSIELRRRAAKKEIRELKSPTRTRFKRAFGSVVKSGAKTTGRGIAIGTKKGFGFLEKVTRPTPQQIAEHKRKLAKEKGESMPKIVKKKKKKGTIKRKSTKTKRRSR